MIRIPHSRSSSISAFSGTGTGFSGSPPSLNSNTLALLDSFLSTKAEEERRFNELAEQAAARVAGLALEADEKAAADQEEAEKSSTMMSVDEYRLAFGEDWQLSQFWYSTSFATHLARSVYSLCTPDSRVVFISSPTAFVAFQHTNPLPRTRLFEYDQRFAVLAPRQFVLYDLDEPDEFPADLKGAVDIVVCDPPFLNEITNKKMIETIIQLLNPTTGKLLLLTSSSVLPILDRLYVEAPIGPLRRTALEVEHGGQLANDFECWGSWEGAETFGQADPEVCQGEAEKEVL